MFRKVLVLAVAAGALTAAAPCAQAMTVRLGDAQLTAKVAINVPVIVSCSAFDPQLVHFSSNVYVNVQQAAGKGIAYGSGGAYGSDPPLFPCDGAEHTVSATVLANPAGPPFHGGKAVVSASAFATAGESCGTGCYFNLTGQSATLGPVATRL